MASGPTAVTTTPPVAVPLLARGCDVSAGDGSPQMTADLAVLGL
ncbi:hypothetical protein [Asanoa ferruginea]|nr:hypothetical protein [Asanoa ferruginea]